MKKHLSKIKLSVLALALLATSIIPSLTAHADQSASLSIVPKKNYTVEPGKSVNDTLTIRNIDKSHTLHLSLRVVDFTFSDDTGTPKLMLDENAPETTWSLKPFLRIPTRVSIEPNSTKTVDMSVAVPGNQGAGSYYSAIVYSSGAEDGGNVGLSASGVTLAFVTIPGQVKENLVMKKLGAYNRQRTGTDGYRYFNVSQPDTIAYTLDNQGNVTESPVGSITIKPLFGKERIIQNINPNGSLALIGQTRTFMSCIKLKKESVNFNGSRSEATTCDNPELWPGYYSVKMNAFYGQNGNRTRDIVGTGAFWYLPVWFIIAVIVILALLIYHGRRFVKYVQSRRSTVKVKRRK